MNAKHSCDTALKKGLFYLKKHDPRKAVCSFKTALKSCPPKKTEQMVKILNFMSIGLRKIGLSNSAIKSILSACRLHKTRQQGKRLFRISNEYGMAATGISELDDWNAFYSIQIKKYLSTRKGFGSGAEEDMVKHLIYDEWVIMNQLMPVAKLSIDERIQTFNETNIIFPFMAVPETEKKNEIYINFHSGSTLKGSSRCSCGSGMPFRICCGRTPGVEELKIGCF